MKKNIYFVLPFFAFFLSTIFYLVLVHSFHYSDPHTNRFDSILSQLKTTPADSVLFIGDSQIQEGINCIIIEQEIKGACFNLGLAGLVPLQLALQKDLIIAAEPQKVIIGVSAAFFDESMNKNDDLFLVFNDHNLTVDNFLTQRLNNKERELLSMNYFEKALYKRKYIIPFYVGFLREIIKPFEKPPYVINNFKNPHFFVQPQQKEDLVAKLEDEHIIRIFEIEKSPRRQRDSFHYLIKELRKADIEVIVLNMPYHPLVWEKVPQESQQAFNDYLQELSLVLDFKVINLQHDFSANDFTDLTHLNAAGSEKLSFNLVEGDHYIIQ